MDTKQTVRTASDDPLGLRDLPPLDPAEDGWPAVARALSAPRGAGAFRGKRAAIGWAMAATVLLAVGLLSRLPGPVEEPMNPPSATGLATLGEPDASLAGEDTLDGLVAMSQTLERQVRELRESSGPMPAASAVYLAELQDMVAQVDKELSFSPDSVNLWGQRVNLLLDLAQVYQHQWEREYGRIASL